MLVRLSCRCTVCRRYVTKLLDDPLACSCGAPFEVDRRFHAPMPAYAPGCEPPVAQPLECETCSDVGMFTVSSYSADGTNATRHILTRNVPCPDCWRGRLIAVGDEPAAP